MRERRCKGDERVAPSQCATSALAGHMDEYGPTVNNLTLYGSKNALSELMDLYDTSLQIYEPLVHFTQMVKYARKCSAKYSDPK